MDSSVLNLFHQFQSLSSQLDALNDGIEPRKRIKAFSLVSIRFRFEEHQYCGELSGLWSELEPCSALYRCGFSPQCLPQSDHHKPLLLFFFYFAPLPHAGLWRCMVFCKHVRAVVSELKVCWPLVWTCHPETRWCFRHDCWTFA